MGGERNPWPPGSATSRVPLSRSCMTNTTLSYPLERANDSDVRPSLSGIAVMIFLRDKRAFTTPSHPITAAHKSSVQPDLVLVVLGFTSPRCKSSGGHDHDRIIEMVGNRGRLVTRQRLRHTKIGGFRATITQSPLIGTA